MADQKNVVVLSSRKFTDDDCNLIKETFPKMGLSIVRGDEHFNEWTIGSIIEDFVKQLEEHDDTTKIVITDYKENVNLIRKNRKDIFLCAIEKFEADSEEELYQKGLAFCKENSCNLVLASNEDLATSRFFRSMVVVPEESYYHLGRFKDAFKGMLEIAHLRSHLSFTRSTVIEGKPIAWNSEEVPDSLRTIINHCIKRGAYKQFRGSTAGHFAVKINDHTFLTSIRKTNFNDIEKVGLVKVVTDGPDTVLAYGAKPSVGGQSQRIVFKDHPEYDCILHFHCPIKETSEVPTVSQREFECGSHQCGQNTSNGLKSFGKFSAVYLDNHGPNIVFNKNIDPQEIIDFVEANFDLEKKTGGFVSAHVNTTMEDAKNLL